MKVESYKRRPGDGYGEEYEHGAVVVKFDNGAGAVLTAQEAQELSKRLIDIAIFTVGSFE